MPRIIKPKSDSYVIAFSNKELGAIKNVQGSVSVEYDNGLVGNLNRKINFEFTNENFFLSEWKREKQRLEDLEKQALAEKPLE